MSKSDSLKLADRTYLELRWVREEPPEPPPSNDTIGLILTLLLIAPFALGVIRLLQGPIPLPEPASALSLRVGPQAGNSNPFLPQPQTAIAPQVSPNRPSPFPNGQTAVVQLPGYAGCIFQADPVRTPAARLGVVLNGQAVTVTGISTRADRVLWYRAMNESTLVPSRHPAAQNQLQAKQMGWIAADCFPQG